MPDEAHAVGKWERNQPWILRLPDAGAWCGPAMTAASLCLKVAPKRDSAVGAATHTSILGLRLPRTRAHSRPASPRRRGPADFE